MAVLFRVLVTLDLTLNMATKVNHSQKRQQGETANNQSSGGELGAAGERSPERYCSNHRFGGSTVEVAFEGGKKNPGSSWLIFRSGIYFQGSRSLWRYNYAGVGALTPSLPANPGSCSSLGKAELPGLPFASSNLILERLSQMNNCQQ